MNDATHTHQIQGVGNVVPHAVLHPVLLLTVGWSPGGRGVLHDSSDGDDCMGTKIRTPKNSTASKKKIPGPNFKPPKNAILNFVGRVVS